MSKTYTTLSREAYIYLIGLIKNLANVSEGIDDLHLLSNGTFSSVKIDTLLNTLRSDCNEYTDRLVANLSRLELKIANDESEISQPNIMYLYKASGETSYSQYVVIEGVKILLGTCDIDMGDYYTITQADAKFVLKTDFDSLKTEVERKVNKTDILINNDPSATDDQVYSAKAINTELDGVIKKTVISTIINSISTDDTVPTNKAVYDSLLANEKLIQYNYDFATSDSLNINLPRAGFYKIDKPTKGVPEGNPQDYVLVNIPWRGDTTLMKFGWQLLFTPRTTYFWARRVWNYTLDYVYTEGDYTIFRQWQRIGATSVTDVPKTTITITVPSGIVAGSGGIYAEYVVKNGWCNVVYMFNITSSTTFPWTKIATGLPKPAVSNVNAILINEVGEIKRVVTRIKTTGDLYSAINEPISEEGWWMGDVTYPVAEGLL